MDKIALKTFTLKTELVVILITTGTSHPKLLADNKLINLTLRGKLVNTVKPLLTSINWMDTSSSLWVA